MKRYLAIDVGGSAMKYGIVENGTSIPYKSSHETPKDSMESLLQAYREIWADCECFGPFDGVAISFTATMDGRTGYCYGGSLEAYTKGINLLETFQTVFPVPVAVENDGNCAALAEGRYGALTDCESAIMITLGTGLGGGLLKEGKIHHGKNSCAGEFSYIFTNAASAFEGQPDVWAIHNGNRALTARLSEKKGVPVPDGKAFFQYADAGDADALAVLREFTNYLAVWLFNLQCIYAPDKIAIGGGISRQPLLMQYLQDSLDHFYTRTGVCLPRAEVVSAQFLSDANLIGAVCWWEDYQNSKKS